MSVSLFQNLNVYNPAPMQDYTITNLHLLTHSFSSFIIQSSSEQCNFKRENSTVNLPTKLFIFSDRWIVV